MEPATQKFLDVQDAWQLEKPLLHLLDSVYIYLFLPSSVDYVIPAKSAHQNLAGGMNLTCDNSI